MNRKLLAMVFLAVGVAALVYAAHGIGGHPMALVAALVALLVTGSLLSRAANMATRLTPMVGRTVVVHAWGEPLNGGNHFRLTSVQAIGAGLHLYLRPQSAESVIHLKIAQPREAEITSSTARIRDAKYVQWAGKKLSRSNHTAPALVVEADR